MLTQHCYKQNLKGTPDFLVFASGCNWCLMDGLLHATGLEPVVVELQQRGDELCTDTDAIQQCLERLGQEAVVAIVTTTSCFAPRCVCTCVRVYVCKFYMWNKHGLFVLYRIVRWIVLLLQCWLNHVTLT